MFLTLTWPSDMVLNWSVFYIAIWMFASDGWKLEDGPDVGHVHTQWTKETTTIAAPLRHHCALCPASVQEEGGGGGLFMFTPESVSWFSKELEEETSMIFPVFSFLWAEKFWHEDTISAVGRSLPLVEDMQRLQTEELPVIQTKSFELQHPAGASLKLSLCRESIKTPNRLQFIQPNKDNPRLGCCAETLASHMVLSHIRRGVEPASLQLSLLLPSSLPPCT